jgi:bifunctional DNA-binding transcriptional regulator/antitoxin component of YhaV-PrlF toxin-antitoxin module
MRAMMDHEGRIVLGREVQTQLGLKPGDEVILENRGNEWVLKSATSSMGLCREGNVLVHRGVCARPVDQELDRIRQERTLGLAEGPTR